jgi:hypothetical protein
MFGYHTIRHREGVVPDKFFATAARLGGTVLRRHCAVRRAGGGVVLESGR